MNYQVQRGQKRYEMSNHLGNVLAVVSDKTRGTCRGDTISYFEAEVLFGYDYSPFGAILPERVWGVSDCDKGKRVFTFEPDTLADCFALTIANDMGEFREGFCILGSSLGSSVGGPQVASFSDGLDYLVDYFNSVDGFNASRTGNTLIIETDLCVIDSSFLHYEYDYFEGGHTLGASTVTIPGVKSDYRFGFNGQEKDDEVKGAGNSYDFGARIYDSRLGRWMSLDPMMKEYTSYSPFSFALNTPITAVDGDGKLVIFIGGLRLEVGAADQGRRNAQGGTALSGIYSNDAFGYWSTDKNTFGKQVDMACGFMTRLQDENAWYTSGSAEYTSQAEDRIADGKVKAAEFHAMVQNGTIKLEDGESIKIVCHSQGGAHSAGFAEQLASYKDADGNPLYNIEVIYYITPHQPTDIITPPGIKSVQYSHPSDAVSSSSWGLNGGSEFGEIGGVTEFDGREIMGKGLAAKCGTAMGNRCGHNVTDNDFIFNIKEGEPGYVAPRQDTSAGQDPVEQKDTNVDGPGG